MVGFKTAEEVHGGEGTGDYAAKANTSDRAINWIGQAVLFQITMEFNRWHPSTTKLP